MNGKSLDSNTELRNRTNGLTNGHHNTNGSNGYTKAVQDNKETRENAVTQSEDTTDEQTTPEKNNSKPIHVRISPYPPTSLLVNRVWHNSAGCI